jgi:hypothetical protein
MATLAARLEAEAANRIFLLNDIVLNPPLLLFRAHHYCLSTVIVPRTLASGGNSLAPAGNLFTARI